MTQTEEIKARIGIDNRSLDAGLKDSKARVSTWAKDIKSEFNRAGDFFKGFGLASFIGDAMQVLKPATEALAKWAGSISVYGVTGERAIQRIGEAADAVKKKFSELNKARWAEEKAVLKALSELDDARLDKIKTFENEQQKIARLQKEYADAEFNATFTAGKKESEIIALREAAIRKQTELQKALTDQQKRQEEEKEEARKKELADYEKRTKRTKEILDNERKVTEQRKKTADLSGQKESARIRQENEKLLPTIEELARFNRGGASRDAQRILFLEQDTKLANLKGNFRYAENNIREIESLKKGLQDRGYLPTDQFEKISKASEESARNLDTLVKEGVKLKDDQ